MSARLADGSEMKYEINVVTGWSDWVQSVQIIAQNLEEIGIKAKVKAYDFAAWFEKVTKGDFDLSIGWSAGGPTPYNYYRGQMSALTRSQSARSATRTGTASQRCRRRQASRRVRGLDR